MKRNSIILGLLLGGLCINAFAEPIVPAGHPNISEYNGFASCKLCHSSTFDTHIADIMASPHWTWVVDDGNNTSTVGKINVINNFCVAVVSNEPRCTSCHIGIGWSDDSFDHANRDAIDCFVCHDGTGAYKKNPKGAGAALPLPEGTTYNDVLQSFQMPDRDNCGQCHFFGGGGEGVKHGTMDGSLSMPSREVDVHMGGVADLTCVDCHRRAGFVSTTADMYGTRYSHTDGMDDTALCKDCHTDAASAHSLPSKHFDILACQTCHVPALARGGKPTKLTWDWSTAGDYIPKEDGSYSADRIIRDDNGWIIYHSKKGTFGWGTDVVPDYAWNNGKMTHLTLDNMPLALDGPTQINTLEGSNGDGLIFPIKNFMSIQPADAGAGTLAVPNLFPGGTNGADDKTPGIKNAYWAGYNWEKAVQSGQEAAGLSWVGPLEWVESEYKWIQSHMVAPKEMALRCVDCHNSWGRMDFAALGLNAGMQGIKNDEVWLGFPYVDGPYYDTGAWLGVVYTTEALDGWVYVYDLMNWMYIPNSGAGWAYVPN
ncbi:MAG: tetrathionate reductase family octaheme c-type cytochrome [Puniceicoccaceae bacterium]